MKPAYSAEGDGGKAPWPRQVTQYRVQFVIMGPQFISHYVPGYVAKPSERIVGAAKVELLKWIDRDARWLGA